MLATFARRLSGTEAAGENEEASHDDGTPGEVVISWLAFFVIVMAARSLGPLFPRIGLPLITGYLVVGAVAGPYVLDLLHGSDVARLSLITDFALAFIAISAGAELYVPQLKKTIKQIVYATTAICCISFAVTVGGSLGLMRPGTGILRYLEELSPQCRVSVSTVMGSIMMARSPASAIAVIKELRAHGPFVSSTLGITVLGDLFVLVAFSITLSLAEISCKGEAFSGATIGLTIGVGIFASVLAGAGFGGVLMLLMRLRSALLHFLILPLGLAIFVACAELRHYSERVLANAVAFEALLLTITAGFVCGNFSSHLNHFHAVLATSGPPVFLIFFTYVGATLNLPAIVESLPFALVIVLLRAASIAIGAVLGLYAGGSTPLLSRFNTHMWLTLLTQAGVSLGLAAEMSHSFPAFGSKFQATVVAIVFVNQVVGPILFKLAVFRVGEAGKGNAVIEEGAHGAPHHRTAFVVGDGAAALTVAGRLLSAQWHVTLLTASEARAAAAKERLAEFASGAQLREREEEAHVDLSDLLTRRNDFRASQNAADGASHVGKQPVLTAAAGADAGGAMAEEEGAIVVVAGARASTVALPPTMLGLAPAAPPGPRSGSDTSALAAAISKRDLSISNGAAARVGAGAADAGGGAHGCGSNGGNAPPHLSKQVSSSSVAAQAAHFARQLVPANFTAMVLGGSRHAYAAGGSAQQPRTNRPSEGAHAHHRADDGHETALYEPFVSAIAADPTTAAIVYALDDDEVAHAMARAVAIALSASPQLSHLRAVRQTVLLASPAWGEAMAALGVMPIHASLAASHLAVTILAAPRQKPVVVLPATASNGETATAMARLLQGPHLWRLGGTTEALKAVEVVAADNDDTMSVANVSNGWSARLNARLAETYARMQVQPRRAQGGRAVTTHAPSRVSPAAEGQAAGPGASGQSV